MKLSPSKFWLEAAKKIWEQKKLWKKIFLWAYTFELFFFSKLYEFCHPVVKTPPLSLSEKRQHYHYADERFGGGEGREVRRGRQSRKLR